MNEIMEGAATPVQIAGFGVALRMKGETPGELGGLAQAMLDRATPLRLPGPLVDLVGTGGDGAHTVNISTMGAIVAAAAGRPDGQARQPGRLVRLRRRGRARGPRRGHRPAPGRDRAAGGGDRHRVPVRPAVPPGAAAHRGTARRELGVPTVFNFLGPVANPARPGAQAVGVADPRMGPVIAGVLAGRGSSALVFHGDDGLDELTTTTTSTVWVVHAGTVSQTSFDPAALGHRPVPPGGPARRRPGAQRRGGPRGAGRRAGPGAGHGPAERGRGAGRRGRRGRARRT